MLSSGCKISIPCLLLGCLCQGVQLEFQSFQRPNTTKEGTMYHFWFNYIDAFLHQRLLREFLPPGKHSPHLGGFIRHFYFSVGSFQAAAQRQFSNHRKFAVVESLGKDFLRKFAEWAHNESETVRNPTGLLWDCREKHFILHRFYGRSGLQVFYNWVIALDRRLQVQISVVLIFTPTEKAFHCTQSFVKFFEEKQRGFSYCGFHSSFELFPTFRNITTQLYFRTTMTYKLKAFFSLCGESLKSGLPPENLKPDEIKVQSYLAAGGMSSVSFHIIGPKASIIIGELLFSAIDFKIHDGPGVLSPVIVSKKKQFSTTTFQCLLLVTVQTHENDFCAKKIQFARGKYIEGTHFSAIVGTTFVLPSHNCQDNFCLLSVSTNGSLGISILVDLIVFWGNDTFTCLHGGLYVLDSLSNGSLSETLSLCDNQTTSVKRKTFSSKSTVVIFLCWYKHYSDISISLHTETFSCQKIHIDPCVLTQNCHKIIGSGNECSKHLQRLSKPNITLAKSKDHILLTIKRKMCFVVEVGRIPNTEKSNSLSQCAFKLIITTLGANFGVLNAEINAVLTYSVVRAEFVLFHWGFKDDEEQTLKNTKNSALNLKATALQHVYQTSSIQLVFRQGAGWSSSWLIAVFRFSPQKFSEEYKPESASVEEIPPGSQPLVRRSNEMLTVNLLFMENDTRETFIKILAFDHRTRNMTLGLGMYKYSKSLAQGLEVSVPAKYPSILWDFNSTSDTRRAFQISGRYAEFDFLENQPFPDVHTRRFQSDKVFLWTFSIQMYEYRIVFIKNRISWHKAQRFCRNLNADLPSFMSKSELDEFLALVKLSKDFPTLEVVFLGLSIDKQSRVSSELCTLLLQLTLGVRTFSTVSLACRGICGPMVLRLDIRTLSTALELSKIMFMWIVM